MADWLDRAVTCGHQDMLRLLLHCPTQAGISTFYKAFETACRLLRVSLLHLFFPSSPDGSGCLAINQVYLWSDKSYRPAYPLETAIRFAQRRHMRSIIKKLLELGADPNGPKYRAHLRRSLHLAIDQRVSGIRPLLDAGANPYLINDAEWTEFQRKGFHRTTYAKTSVIGKALRKALKLYVKSKPAKAKPAKGVEGFLAEVDEKIKEDTMAVKDVNLKPAFFGCTQS